MCPCVSAGGAAQGAELKFEDAHFFGNFKPKPAKRSLNPDQWLSAAEHHRDKWWGIKQVFRVWDQWNEAVTLAGDPARTGASTPCNAPEQEIASGGVSCTISNRSALVTRRLDSRYRCSLIRVGAIQRGQ